MESFVKNGRLTPNVPAQSTLKRGWYWGSQEFRERVLDLYGKVVSGKKNRDYQTSPLLKDHGIQQCEAWIQEACRHYQTNETELLAGKRGDWMKASVAWRICRDMPESCGLGFCQEDNFGRSSWLRGLFLGHFVLFDSVREDDSLDYLVK